MKKIVALLILAFSTSSPAESVYILLETTEGEMVLELHPEWAPRHVEQLKALVSAGAYNGATFFRVEDNFVIQLSGVENRQPVASPEQLALNSLLPAEFSDRKHRKGILSMARQDGDPNSARSSFSILLGDSPHLNHKYTIFGELYHGADTVNRIQRIPREGNRPKTEVAVTKASIVPDVELLMKDKIRTPSSEIETVRKTTTNTSPTTHWGFNLVPIISSFLAFLLYDRFSKSNLLSIMMVVACIHMFALLVHTRSIAENGSYWGLALFVSIIGTFKFMNRFETKR